MRFFIVLLASALVLILGFVICSEGQPTPQLKGILEGPVDATKYLTLWKETDALQREFDSLMRKHASFQIVVKVKLLRIFDSLTDQQKKEVRPILTELGVSL